MTDTVRVRYSGPNSKGDPRTIDVSPDEAERLEATGLWTQKKASAKPATAAPETDSGGESDG